jgi:hypothetical protein
MRSASCQVSELRGETLTHQCQKFGSRREIPVGVAGLRMTEIGGEEVHALADVVAGAVPVHDGADRERVTKIMESRSTGVGAGLEAGHLGQPVEDPLHVDVLEAGPERRDEEGASSALGEATTVLVVIPQSQDGARVQHQFPGLAELGIANDEESLIHVDVLAVEPDSFTGAHAGFAAWEALIWGSSTDAGTIACLFLAREGAHRGTPTWGAWMLSIARFMQSFDDHVALAASRTATAWRGRGVPGSGRVGRENSSITAGAGSLGCSRC